jgi:NADH-quinone oxidoreductase subunit N
VTPFVTRLDLWAAGPEIVVSAAGCLLLLLEAFVPSARKNFATLSIFAVGGYLLALGRVGPGNAFSGSLDGSRLAWYFGTLIAWAAILTLLSARGYLESAESEGLVEEGGEFYALILWGLAGVSLMARGLDLLVIFLGLETFSLCFYILAAYFRKIPASAEAGLKYFLTGAFASSFTLFGIALIYGKTGTILLARFPGAELGADPLFAFGLVFLLAGFGFKIALAPFHAWAPDVYAGMPTPAVAFLSVAPKGAALIVLFRVFAAAFPGTMPHRLQIAVAAAAVLSMSLGNLVALAQRDMKRLLAYSGIAHMGYVAIALAVFGREAFAAVLLYLGAYAVTNIGAFAAVAALYRDEDKPHPMGLLAGAGKTSPFAAGVLALCMISLAGIPSTAGFIGKFFVFKAAIEKDLLWLALVGVANSLVSLGYYLKVVYYLYMRDPIGEAPRPISVDSLLALALCGLGVLGFGILPAGLLAFARDAAAALPGLAP